MDGQRFDDFVKILATTGSRRRAVKTLLAAAAGGALALRGRRGAGAGLQGSGCTRYGRVCPGGGCCTTNGAICHCYGNGHCRCQCPPGATYDHANDACRCATHADCDDGNACTVGLCGPVSRLCFQIPISSTCTQCRTNADCPGGNCCHGRCCPGTECRQAPTGEPICCQDCGGGTPVCCDTINYDPSCVASPTCDGIGYDISPAACYGGAGACASCPPICNQHQCGYADVGAGEGVCGVDNACEPLCSAPVGGVQ